MLSRAWDHLEVLASMAVLVSGVKCDASALPVGGAFDDEGVCSGGEPVDGGLGEEGVAGQAEPFNWNWHWFVVASSPCG